MNEQVFVSIIGYVYHAVKLPTVWAIQSQGVYTNACTQHLILHSVREDKMGDIRTDIFATEVTLSGDLVAYRKALQQILIDVGLLNETASGDDILIVRTPHVETADSAYGVVISIEWSANNSDFTDLSRTIDLATLKSKISQLVKERILPFFFPTLMGKPMAVNVWLKRLDSAAFCVGMA